MPVGALLRKLLGGSGSGVQFRTFECDDCGSTFESAKEPDRAQCPECLSDDTIVRGTAEGS